MKINYHRLQLWSVIGMAVFSSGTLNAQTITEYTYGADKVYPVRTGLGLVTQIEISPLEDIKDYSTGLSSGWDLARRGNVFYIRPKGEKVDTNMTIRTSVHNYLFDLKVVSKNWKSLTAAKQQGVQYKIKFNYPQGTSFSAQSVRNSDSGMSTVLNGHVGYFTNYDYAADRRSNWLVPIKVYDDGNFTYIHLKNNRFMTTGNFPTVTARKTRDGEELILNTNVQGNIIIVNGTYPFLVLRHDNDVVGIRRNYQ
ncbi:type IV secretion system protein VirB9 [Neisseria dentiae]|uniref:Type IV secretion system protein VirB9 n=1 Tax=Neisseria dentiae TaxID=194197 RepID=A0A1X3D464_9NEIS|nr:TrbG/VirB9 family P-type conjugative transfer protein [Neisseria dentiae]OSI14511.1 type IV secretion system protein VirB9 [Neisseria dentiae]QMT44346.1 TrbG/VirB9 family P-type conjugative transfer protein [Neisseria dentiae]STZ50032.1 Pertussis toxin liberation protein F [Neisseria dentiae]